MKEYELNYYPAFKCVAEKCRHTCCAGWEMNIDEQTLGVYKNDSSNFSGELKGGIDFKKSCFRADKNKRCAFLNEDGLCKIIINLGEDSLCQVCRDHPRFRAFFNDRIEMGLGFCCEEATKIILSFKDRIEPVLIKDDGQAEELDFNQKNILEFREKALALIQDREIEINQRIANLLSLCSARVEEKDLAKIIKAFLKLERLDGGWTARLKAVKKKGVKTETDIKLAHYAEQFLANCLYRHLYDAEDTLEVRARAIACVFGWWIINGVLAQELIYKRASEEFDLIIDVIRAYSAEAEYSQGNLDKLNSFTNKFIKIN